MKVAVKNLNFQDNETTLLEEINFDVTDGQCLVISGSSGSGKSLLLSIICGLVTPSSGRIFFDKLEFKQMSHAQLSDFRKHSSVIFQIPALLSNLTIYENLALPLSVFYQELSDRKQQGLIHAIAQQFGITAYLQERVDKLPNGAKYLTSFVRAMISQPNLLFWDAPLSGIDKDWIEPILKVLHSMKAESKTLILFSNKERLIRELADTHLHLSNSTLVSRNYSAQFD